jgi:hypothetical protein
VGLVECSVGLGVRFGTDPVVAFGGEKKSSASKKDSAVGPTGEHEDGINSSSTTLE